MGAAKTEILKSLEDDEPIGQLITSAQYVKHFDVVHEAVLDVTQRDFRRRHSRESRNWILIGIHTQ